MDISVSPGAATLPPAASLTGQPGATAAVADPGFAALLLDAPAPMPQALAPAMPVTNAPPAVPASPTELAGITPALPDEMIEPAESGSAPSGQAKPVAGKQGPKSPQPLPPATLLVPEAGNMPEAAPTAGVEQAETTRVLPTAPATPALRKPAAAAEAAPDEEIPTNPAAPVAAAVTPAPAPHPVRTTADKPVRSEKAESADPAEPRKATHATGFERVATTPAASRAAPEAAFHAEAAPIAADAATANSTPAPVASAIAGATGAASPAPAAPAESVRHAQPSLHLGDAFGERMGVAIARRIGEGGEELVVRMEPAELGRVHVRLSFDEQGSLRAVLAAESGSVIEALRRDAGELARALGDAGVRTDAQSFRFDRGGNGAGEQGQAAWARWQNQANGAARGEEPIPADDIAYRPVRRSGRLDLMA